MGRGGLIIPKDSTVAEQQAFRFLNERLNESDREISEIRKATEALSEPEDKTPPHPVTALRAVKYETHIRLEWHNPVNADLRSINITKTVDGQPDSETFIVAAPTNFIDDFDTIATSDYVYELITYDRTGNKSAPEVIEVEKETLPAPDKIFVKGEAWRGDDLEISWDAVDGFGVSGYRVDIYNETTLLRSEIVAETGYTYTYAKNTTDGLFYELGIKVYTLDALGNPSFSPSEKTITHVEPSTPGAVTASLCDLGFKLNWELLTEPGILGYVVALDGDVLEENHTTGEYLYKTLLKKGDYRFAVASKNKFNQRSAWAVQNYSVLGPGKPAILTADDIDNTVTLKWLPPVSIELPIVEYDIRKGPYFEIAHKIGRKQGTFTTITENTSGTYKYWVAAVDSAGNIGEGISITASVDEPSDYVLNVQWENDFKDGNATNILVLDDGTAIAPFKVGQTWEEKFIGTGSKESPQFESFQDLIDEGYNHYCQPVPETSEYYEEFDYGAVLSSTSIALNVDKEEYGNGTSMVKQLAAKETLSDTYQEKTADRIFQVRVRYVRDRIRFISDGNGFVVLNKHVLRLDSKLKSDAGKAVVSDAQNGKTVQFGKQFVDVASIILQPWGDGSQVITAVLDFEDVPYPTHFTIYLFDASGNKITGTVSWDARGY